MPTRPPESEAALMARATCLAGRSLGDIAQEVGEQLPHDLRGHKGLIGELMERVLGAEAGSMPLPDFRALGVELKTIPIARNGRPKESTHVCTVAVDGLVGQRWETSTVRRKLSRVLWVPVEGEPGTPLPQRRVGQALLWSPSPAEESVLRADWSEHMELIATGRVDEIDARLGTWLQIRPKGANRDARIEGHDAAGQPTVVLPRGFYLRTSFTARVLGLEARGA